MTDDADEVTLTFTFSAREYRRLNRGVNLLRRPAQGVLAALWLVVVVSFFVYLTRHSVAAARVLDAALIILLLAGATLFVAPFVLWARHPSLRNPRTVVFSSQGITSVTSDATATFEWERIRSEALENERLICFMIKGGRSSVLIPKRVVAAELDPIRRLASARVKAYIGFAAGHVGARERAEARGVA